MRIGVHIGEVIAGVTGTTVVRYDIYGPDVMVANKMESEGRNDKVNVSNTTKLYLEKVAPGEFKYFFNQKVEIILHR